MILPDILDISRCFDVKHTIYPCFDVGSLPHLEISNDPTPTPMFRSLLHDPMDARSNQVNTCWGG
jgi:hypothetical protein